MKNRLYYLIIFTFVFASCQETKTDTIPTTKIIEKLNAKYQDTQDKSVAQELLTHYAKYTAANPDDIANCSKYLRRSAQIYGSNGEHVQAAGTIVLALKKFYQGRETEANIASLIQSYNQLGNQDAANTTMNGYIMAYPNGSKTTEYTSQLGDKKQRLDDRLQAIAVDIVSSPDGQPGLNQEAVNKFIGVAEIYALTNNSKDTLASDYLFKAGKLAMTIGNSEKATECFEWIYTSLKSSKEAPSALFTHAFTLDNQLGRKEEARGLYQRFLKEYPEHHFADDSEFQLKNLGKNDAEIIEEFKKKSMSK